MNRIIRLSMGGILVLVRLNLTAQTVPDTSRLAILSAAREIINNSGKCALITQDEQGIPQVRTMDPFSPEEDFTVWLATNPNSRKVKQIKSNSRITLYYADKGENGYVTIHGTAVLIYDQKEKDKRWKEEWKSYYPNRSDAYLLIKVVPDYLEVINYKRGLNGNPKTWEPVKLKMR